MSDQKVYETGVNIEEILDMLRDEETRKKSYVPIRRLEAITLYEEIKRLRAAVSRTCLYTPDPVFNAHNSECGHTVAFAGKGQTLADNGFNFCPQCGGHIVINKGKQ